MPRLRASQRGPNQPRTKDQREHERDTSSYDGQPSHFATFFASEQLPRFSAGQEHQQQQTEPIDEIQNVCLVPSRVQESGYIRQASDESWAQHYSGKDFADDLGLPKFDEEIPQQLRGSDQKQEDEENCSQIGIGHRQTSPRLRCRTTTRVCWRRVAPGATRTIAIGRS